MRDDRSEAWPSPTPRGEVLTRVVQRGRRIRRVRRLLTALAVGGVVVAGAGGYALGASGRIDVVADGTVTIPDATAAYHACPGTSPLGDLHRGDRVLLTGVSEDGAWYELRSPIDLLDRAWVPAAVVTPDEDLDLPVVGCGLTDEELATVAGVVEADDADGATTTTTTTTEPGAATTTDPADGPTPPGPTEPGPGTTPSGPTTVPSGSATTAPPGEGPTPTPPPTSPPTVPPTSPTTPPDTTGPTIGGFQRSVAAINETGSEFCLPPATSTVRASVSDPSGVTSVTLLWSFTGAGGTVSGSRPMTLQGGAYQATLGPFTATTINTVIGSVDVNWSVTATDGAGNTRTVAAPPAADVTLHNC